MPKNVLQLTLPLLKPTEINGLPSVCDARMSFDFSYAGHQAFATAEVKGHWHDLILNDGATDSLKLLDAVAAIRAIKADTGHAGGVRIHFYSSVTYRNLVCLLDSMYHLQLKAFWLDIRRSPAIFYAIAPRPMTLAERRCYKENECQGTAEAVTYIIEHPLTVVEQLKNLRQPERRPLLLVAVGSMVLLLSASAAQSLWANPSRRAPF